MLQPLILGRVPADPKALQFFSPGQMERLQPLLHPSPDAGRNPNGRCDGLRRQRANRFDNPKRAAKVWRRRTDVGVNGRTVGRALGDPHEAAEMRAALNDVSEEGLNVRRGRPAAQKAPEADEAGQRLAVVVAE